MKLTKEEFKKALKDKGAKKLISLHMEGKITLTDGQLNKAIKAKNERQNERIKNEKN